MAPNPSRSIHGPKPYKFIRFGDIQEEVGPVTKAPPCEQLGVQPGRLLIRRLPGSLVDEAPRSVRSKAPHLG